MTIGETDRVVSFQFVAYTINRTRSVNRVQMKTPPRTTPVRARAIVTLTMGRRDGSSVVARERGGKGMVMITIKGMTPRIVGRRRGRGRGDIVRTRMRGSRRVLGLGSRP